MTEPMTTDQRVALALTTTMQTSGAVAQAFAALVGNDVAPELGRLAERQVETQTDIAGRILELSEALAAGKVRIVGEGHPLNRRQAMLALTAAGMTPSDAETQLRIIDQRMGELGSSFEQHAAIVRNTVSTEVRVHYLAAVFGNDAVRAAVVLAEQ